jgi:ATP-dependent Zn protease
MTEVESTRRIAPMARKPSRGKPPSQRTGRRERARRGGHDPNDIRYVATHEAGHAVSAVVLGLVSVDIHRRLLPNGAVSLGFTQTRPLHYAEVSGKGQEAAMPHLLQRLTGSLAEAAVNRHAKVTGGDAQDLEAARRIAALAICRAVDNGGGKMTITPEELRRNEPRIARLLQAAQEAAARLISEHRETIARVADLLLERKELAGAEVDAIVERGLASCGRSTDEAENDQLTRQWQAGFMALTDRGAQ